MHFFTFLRSALSTGRRVNFFCSLLCPSSHVCIWWVTSCLGHVFATCETVTLGPSDWVGILSFFFPLAESFEITGRKFYKPVLLLLWITEKRFHLSDVDIITVAVCLQKATFYCAEKSQTLQELVRMTQWMSSTLLWSLINLEDSVCAWLCGQTESNYSFFTCASLRRKVILNS